MSASRPEPEWWAEARRLRADGLTVRKVADALGRSAPSVMYAVCEEHREKQKAAAILWGKFNPGYRTEAARNWKADNPERHKAGVKRRALRKAAARAAARVSA